MKRSMTAVVLMWLLLGLNSGSVIADKPTPVPAEFRTASDSFDLTCGSAIGSTQAMFRYDVCECASGPCTSPGLMTACDSLEVIVTSNAVGKPIRWDESLPAFTPIKTRLTDGSDSFISYGYGAADFPSCGLGMEEVDYFRKQAGAN